MSGAPNASPLTHLRVGSSPSEGHHGVRVITPGPSPKARTRRISPHAQRNGEEAPRPFRNAGHVRASSDGAFNVVDTELRMLTNAKNQLTALATKPGAAEATPGFDEEYIFGVITSAHSRTVELEKKANLGLVSDQRAQLRSKAILELCTAWLRFAAADSLREGSSGLRGPLAAEMICAMMVAILSPDTPLGQSLRSSVNDTDVLSIFGAAVCNFSESALSVGLGSLRTVISCCSVHARRSGKMDTDRLNTSIEAFRGNLFIRLLDQAARPARRCRVPHFKELVTELGRLLSGVYDTVQVFEMGCLLSLQLTLALSVYCPEVPESDALEAVEWMVSVVGNLLDQADKRELGHGAGAGGALASRDAISEWFADSGLFQELLRHAGCQTQHHLRHLLAQLLERKAISVRELVQGLREAGAFSPSDVPPPNRLAMQGALISALSGLGQDMIVEFFGEICAALGFVHLSVDGVELLVRVTLLALAAGHDPGALGSDASFDRSLAFSHLLRYLSWGYQQPHPPEEQLEFARRAILHSLATHPRYVPLLPTIVAETLKLVASGPVVPVPCGRSSVHPLGIVAVDLASISASFTCSSPENVSMVTADAVTKLCSLLPLVADTHLSDSQLWMSFFIDVLACFLKLPGAQINSPQVGALWSRLIVRPVLHLPLTASAMQYFRLAVLAQQGVKTALIAPLLMGNHDPQVRLAYASIFCPASFEDDPPPLSVGFFFPELHAPTVDDAEPPAMRSEDSPARSASPSPRRGTDAALDLVQAEALNSPEGAEVLMSVQMPEPSTEAPRLRLDQAQSVLSGQSASLFGELAVYDAVERRLWNEFDERGCVEDKDVLRQRAVAAERCFQSLRREVDDAARAGRKVPTALLEAHAKFSGLIQLLGADSQQQLDSAMLRCEDARARAEDELIEARSASALASVRSRRAGRPADLPVPPQLAQARAAFVHADAMLLVELRRVATRAQLGFVEALGTPGLARGLRAAGNRHGDALLDRLQRHGPWLLAQASEDSNTFEMGRPRQESTFSAPPASVRVVPDPPALARSEGLSGYCEFRAISASGHVLTARRKAQGDLVVLKRTRASAGSAAEAAIHREARALKALRSPSIIQLQALFSSGGESYLELAWCGGGNLFSWCQRHLGVVGAVDVEAFVRCLGLFRQVWLAVAAVHRHSPDAAHGDLALQNVLLSTDHKPILADFKRCALVAGDRCEDQPRPSQGFAAPEDEDPRGTWIPPTQTGDVYAVGVMMAKAFMGLQLDVAGCLYHDTTGLRNLPDDQTDVDVADLVQLALARDPRARPSAETAASHRALDPAPFLRRRGMLSRGKAGTPSDGLLAATGTLREEYRGRRVEELLIFQREAVFEGISQSLIGEWSEEALLGEWRVVLDGESGVDGGGLRREVVSLFFEQLEQSSLVLRAGGDSLGSQPTLFIADRQEADRSPQQWRQIWAAIGAMTLRALVHVGTIPTSFSSAVVDCCFGRIGRLPPDDDDYDSMDACPDALAKLREVRGDEWARSELLDVLRRLRRADEQKEAGYRWMLSQRSAVTSGGHLDGSLYTMPSQSLDTFEAMLEGPSFRFLRTNSRADSGAETKMSGAVLEWALLWDIYLKYLGGGDRWLAYEAFADGLTVRGRRSDLWNPMTGEQIVDALEGAMLTPDVVVQNLEFKPDYGYDKQIGHFRRVIQSFSSEELSMFLRFATGIGRLPANRGFPSGQRLKIRFMPDQLDRLPSAHTCFWIVDVPPYQHEEDMAQKLRQAIVALQPFTFS